MTDQISAKQWLAISVVGISVVGGVWLASDSSPDNAPAVMGKAPKEPRSSPGASEAPPIEAPAGASFAADPIAPQPDHYIGEEGRLSIDATALPPGAIVLGLALDEDERGAGQSPLSAVVVSADDGRRLELSATSLAGSQSDVQLEVDSSWFAPGLYMIQLRTAEKSALPLRRYVLEVR